LAVGTIRPPVRTSTGSRRTARRRLNASLTPSDPLQGVHDCVLLAVKAQHTEKALAQLAPHLSPDGVVVSLQNGLNEQRIAAAVGAQRTIGGFVNFAADYLAPGRISLGNRGLSSWARCGGASPHVHSR
jgi:2-dehydropantoate 2-reductase